MSRYMSGNASWPDRALRSVSGTGLSSGATSCRSIWISDLHLGTRRCKAGELLDFLERHEAENLYLVGDIVDGWVMGPSWYWNRTQGAVVEKITQWHQRGVRVILLPGNHDELSVDLTQALLGPIPVATELIHRTAGGQRMLVIHGHQFDGSLNPNRLLAMMGTQAYHAALRIDRWYSGVGDGEGRTGLSLGDGLKDRVRRAVAYMTDFRDRAVLDAVRRHRADGVICGHTHRAEQRRIGSISYANDGDWVRSCTALVEDRSGALRLLSHSSESDQAAHQAPTEERRHETNGKGRQLSRRSDLL